MAQRSGRITCPRCGANNFDTVTACWKCGTALGSGAAAGSPAPPASTIPLTVPPVERPAQAPQQTAYTPVAYPSATTPPPALSGNTGVAKRAAFALGITIPWIGLPVGWVFMMIEDSRKQAIGRICAVWSMIGEIVLLDGGSDCRIARRFTFGGQGSEEYGVRPAKVVHSGIVFFSIFGERRTEIPVGENMIQGVVHRSLRHREQLLVPGNIGTA